MSAMTEQFDADVAAVEPELPVQFFFKEKEYTGSKTHTIDSLDMEDAGFQQRYDFELDVRTVVFAGVSAPEKNSAIKIGTVTYRIEKITPSQDGVMFTFHMVERT